MFNMTGMNLWKYIFVYVVLVLSKLTFVHSFCVFGSQSNCLLPCHCADDASCDPNTGRCPQDTCKAVEYLGGYYWTGDSCQTGNIATGKYASQIGTYYNPGFKINATADKAIDGNLTTYAYSNNPSTVTGWWMVDLGFLHVIEKAKITAYNLGNSLIRLENYTVWVGNSSDVFDHVLCGYARSPLQPMKWNSVYCESGSLIGRYVSIRKAAHDKNKQWLPLHEVAIIGYPVSSVNLRRCLRYKPNDRHTLLNLQCDQCENGWLEPYCRKPVTVSTTSKVSKSTSKVSTTSSSTTTMISTTKKSATPNETDSLSTHYSQITPLMPTENGSGLSVTIFIIIGVFGVFALIGLISTPILCFILCRRCRSKNNVTQHQPPKTVMFNNKSGVLNTPANDGITDGYMDLDKGYEPLKHVYLGIGGTTNPSYTTPVATCKSFGRNDGYEIPQTNMTGQDIDYDDVETGPVYATVNDDHTYNEIIDN